MEQDITISENIVNFFYEDLIVPNLDISLAKECYKIIKSNYFVTDKNNVHLKKIEKKLNELPECKEKDILKKDFLGLIINKSKPIEFNLTNILTDYHLANASLDKIYFDPKISNVGVVSMKLSLNYGITDIEIHDCQSFLYPDIDHVLKHVPLSYDLKKDLPYDLVKLLKPFIRNSKLVKFIDPYIRNYTARNHLKKILEIIPHNAKIIIKTIPEADINDSVKVKEFNKIIHNRATIESYIPEKRKKSADVEFNYYGHKERFIITDKYKIYIPGGLDQFTEEGKPNIKDSDDNMTMWVNFNISTTLPL